MFESNISIFKLTSSKKNDQRIHRFSLHIHESNDNWRIDKITNQKQIRSISNHFRNKIRFIASNRDESTSYENLFQRSHHIFLYNLWSLLNVVFACKKRIRTKICFCIKKKQKTSFEIFRSIFEKIEDEKSLANHVLCQSVAIRRYRSMIAIKSRDVTKMIKMTVSRDD